MTILNLTKGLHYNYTWSQIRGYKEQVEGNLKACNRIAKEMGGKILTDNEIQDTIPEMSKTWKTCYQEFAHEKTKGAHMWRLGGEGMAEVWYYIGWIDDLIKLEEGYNRRLKEKYNWIVQPYYTRIFESGIGGHLRYMPCVDMADDFQREKTMKIREEMHTWVLDNYPNIHTYGYRMVKSHSIGMGSVLSKIREALDPNHIMYMPGDERLESEDEAETATAAS